MTEAQALGIGTTVGALLHYFVVTDRLAPTASPVHVEEEAGCERVTVFGNEVGTGADVAICARVRTDGTRALNQTVRVWDEACQEMSRWESVADYEVDDH